jgi:hypothetical protein
MPEVYLTAQYDAAPLEVFEFFLDHEKFGSIWAGETRRIKDADGDNPNDVGSVRSVKVGLSTIQEQQVTATRPTADAAGLIEYKVIKGAAITDHFGHIEFHPRGDGGTEIRYTIRLQMAVPGLAWLVLRNIKQQWMLGSAKLAVQFG